jgi:predicted CXXCH cytochrome family protein
MYADPHAERGVSANYHGIREHDTANIRCVRCHTSHTTDSDAKNRFISQAAVRPVCRECHKEMLGAVRAVR